MNSKTSAYWARYDSYEYRRGGDGILYITPAPAAKPSVYDPLENAEEMVLDALNTGRLVMQNAGVKRTQEAVLDFVTKYGLMGFMTALPTTPDFMDYEAVYLPKNHFIKAETMTARDYVEIFFPFGKPDFYKDERTAEWHLQGNAQSDRELLALAMTFSNGPLAVNMALQRDYAERYDWLVTQFQDLAFTLVSSHLYYIDKDVADDTTLEIYRNGISAFGGIAPTYHISLYDDGPVIVWDFHSLLRGVQMMFSFALTDKARPVHVCHQCGMAFAAAKPNAVFCGLECEKRYVARKKGKAKMNIIDINKIIESLSKKRNIFHSEADFQFALAWEFQYQFPAAKIRLEYPIELDSRETAYIDILVNFDGYNYPVELKYKTKYLTAIVDDELFDLKYHKAYNDNLYGFIDDIRRIEDTTFVLRDMKCGFVIWLTNDSHYWKMPKKTNTGSFAFSVYEGAVKSGIMKSRDDMHIYSVELLDEYIINWERYSDLGLSNGLFRYALLEIAAN